MARSDENNFAIDMFPDITALTLAQSSHPTWCHSSVQRFPCFSKWCFQWCALFKKKVSCQKKPTDAANVKVLRDVDVIFLGFERIQESRFRHDFLTRGVEGFGHHRAHLNQDFYLLFLRDLKRKLKKRDKKKLLKIIRELSSKKISNSVEKQSLNANPQRTDESGSKCSFRRRSTTYSSFART